MINRGLSRINLFPKIEVISERILILVVTMPNDENLISFNSHGTISWEDPYRGLRWMVMMTPYN
jgi:hypothetical protein